MSTPTTPPRVMRGATAGAGGAAGYVPAPASGDQDKILHGDKTWRTTTNAAAATVAEVLAGIDDTKFATPAGVDARVANGASTRAIADHVICDGATTNRGFLWKMPASLAVNGGLVVTKPFIFLMPTANPASDATICSWGTLQGLGSGSTNIQGFSISSGGNLIARRNTDSSNRQGITFTGAPNVATHGGRWIIGVVTFYPGSSTMPTLRFGSGTITGTETTWNGTPPDWLAVTGDNYLELRDWPAGEAVPLGYGYGEWTDAEVLAFVQTSMTPRWWRVATGSAVNTNVAGQSLALGSADANSNGLSDAFNASTSVQAGALGASTGAYFGRITATDNFPSAKRSLFAASQPAGMALFLRAKVRSSGTLTGIAFQLAPTSGGTAVSNKLAFATSGTAAEVSGVLVSTGAWARLNIGRFAAGDSAAPTVGDQYDIDDLEVVVLGPAILPGLQPGCAVLTDSGNNRTPGLATPGMSVAGLKPEIIALPSQVISADAFLLADQAIVPAGYEVFACVLSMLTGTSTGTVTIRKTSSGGSTLFTGTLPGAAGLVSLTATPTLFATADKIHVACSSYAGSTTFTVRPLARRIY